MNEFEFDEKTGMLRRTREAKRKRAVKALERCFMPSDDDEYEEQCVGCPYYGERTVKECKEDLKSDLLDLLKNKEE